MNIIFNRLNKQKIGGLSQQRKLKMKHEKKNAKIDGVVFSHSGSITLLTCVVCVVVYTIHSEHVGVRTQTLDSDPDS